MKYKFVDGFSQISHSVKFIEYKQLIFWKPWITKFIDTNVKDHLHALIVVAREFDKLYSCNSSFISFQNHTDIVINNVEIFVIDKAKSNLPIKRIRLIKNKSEIFQ